MIMGEHRLLPGILAMLVILLLITPTHEMPRLRHRGGYLLEKRYSVVRIRETLQHTASLTGV